MDALLPILRRGVHVVLSDVDCVWLHDPNPMVRGLVAGYEDFANADLIVSTDCHNPQVTNPNPNPSPTRNRTLTLARTLTRTLTRT